jgi:hypothetical protein
MQIADVALSSHILPVRRQAQVRQFHGFLKFLKEFPPESSTSVPM